MGEWGREEGDRGRETDKGREKNRDWERQNKQGPKLKLLCEWEFKEQSCIEENMVRDG